jgi:hypothetical protein
MTAMSGIAHITAAIIFEEATKLPIRQRGHLASEIGDRENRAPHERAPQFFLDKIKSDGARSGYSFLTSVALDGQARHVIARRQIDAFRQPPYAESDMLDVHLARPLTYGLRPWREHCTGEGGSQAFTI